MAQASLLDPQAQRAKLVAAASEASQAGAQMGEKAARAMFQLREIERYMAQHMDDVVQEVPPNLDGTPAWDPTQGTPPMGPHHLHVLGPH